MLELELMELIYKGVDPRTGELLNTLRDPVLDKRRAVYLQTLRRAARLLKPPRSAGSVMVQAESQLDADKPANHGAPWSHQEEARLRELWSSATLPTLDQLAQAFGRGEAGISSRLVKLGIFPNREAARLESERRQGVHLSLPAGGQP
jgi:hypothetical protein